jgi:methyl-accepting chemotaxis protein
MFRNLKFSHKMWLLPGLATLSFLVLLGVTRVLNQRNAALLAQIEKGYEPALEMSSELEVTVDSIQRALQDAVAAEDLEALAHADQLRDNFMRHIEAARANPVLQKERLDLLSKTLGAYYGLARSTSEMLIRKNAPADMQERLRQMTSGYNQVTELLASGTSHDKREMAGAFEAARQTQARSAALSALVILACIALLAILSAWIVRGVAGPLLALTNAAARIAEEGDLSHRLEIRSTDEVGKLAASFQAMVEKLRDIPVTLTGSVDELSQAVASLSKLTEDQTENLTRQARGLSEASATTQEIKQTSAVASEKAESVLAVTRKAETLSTSGQQAIEASRHGLQAIRAQVDDMVGRINELSQRMQLVGEITERVKDLADQSNMLALNAAIEATRAGEFGKGFSVVAREIRSLADQSLQSAKRIREILTEIQLAIRATVQATSEGNKRVEEGLKQVRVSGESLRGITSIVEQSSQAARQIVATVSQQNAGIVQISGAIGSLNQAMQEALGGVKLAQDSAANVQNTSTRLSTLVKGFKV